MSTAPTVCQAAGPRIILLAPPRHVAWLRRWAALWEQVASWSERRQRERDLGQVDQLSVHTLKDIGAPEWLQATAQARQDAAQLRLSEMRQWRDG